MVMKTSPPQAGIGQRKSRQTWPGDWRRPRSPDIQLTQPMQADKRLEAGDGGSPPFARQMRSGKGYTRVSAFPATAI